MRIELFALLFVLVTGACATTSHVANVDGVEPNTGYDGGFFVRSDDGAHELVIEGLVQTTFNVYDEREPSAEFDLKRVRPEFAGKLANSLRFRIEPKFGKDDVELEEAWAGADILGGNALLMIGRMKAPFGLEEVRSRRHIDFQNFSILTQFAPAEDHGVFVLGHSNDERWEYGVALYNGTGGDDTNDGKDVAARLMLHTDCGLQLGVAATTGNQDEDVAGDEIENAMGMGVIEFAPGLRLDGRRTRAGLEAAWFDGPWFAQAEYLHQNQDMSLGASESDIEISGAYLNVSHVLTGESKTFKGVVPDKPYDFATGTGSGAWVLALRLSQLELDDSLATNGFAVPGTITDEIRSASLGLNWIANRHAILRTSVVVSEYGSVVTLGGVPRSEEAGLLIEWQMHF